MPNVVLEAIACGTPVAASAVWGTPEILEGSGVGALIDERSAQGVAKAVREIEQDMPHRQHVLRYAETLGWEATTQGQLGLFRRIAGGRPGRSADHS
jgi:glycosyltransferase involved in cell wall biosynthesis